MDFKKFLNDLHSKTVPGSGSVLCMNLCLAIGLFLKVGNKSGWKTISNLKKCLETSFQFIEKDSQLFLDFLKTKKSEKICDLSLKIRTLIDEVEKNTYSHYNSSMQCDYDLAKDLLLVCKKYNEEHLRCNKEWSYGV